jgi:hypothetical protein
MDMFEIEQVINPNINGMIWKYNLFEVMEIMQ